MSDSDSNGGPKVYVTSLVANARFICMGLFGVELLVVVSGIVLLCKCFQYNMFYVLGLPPQIGRAGAAVFSMFCTMGGSRECIWAIRTAVSNVFWTIISITIMSLYMNRWDMSTKENNPTQYYGRRIFYWGTIGLLIYTLVCAIALCALNRALGDADKMKIANISPFVRKNQ